MAKKKKWKVSVWKKPSEEPRVDIVTGESATAVFDKVRSLKMNAVHCEIRVEPASSDDETKIKADATEKARLKAEKKKAKDDKSK